MKKQLFIIPFLFGCQKAELVTKPTYTVSFEVKDQYKEVLKDIVVSCGNEVFIEDFKGEYQRIFTITSDTYVSCQIRSDEYFQSEITVKLNGVNKVHMIGTCQKKNTDLLIT